jgi:hypothetical protein
MKNFRRMFFAVLIAGAFAIPAFADGGITQGPPAPGQTDTPPSMASGETNGPDAAAPGDMEMPGLTAVVLDLQGLFF